MFNTVKEVHIAVENGLQHITANRKQSIKPEYIDIALNMSLLKYIDESLTPEKSKIQKGFEHNQVDYDEFEPLRDNASLPVYYEDGIYFSLIPYNYKNHINSSINILYNRALNTIPVTTEVETKYVYRVSFPTPANTGNLYPILTVSITKGKVITTYTPNIPIYTKDGLFILINDIIQYFQKNNQAEVYWQDYNGAFYANQLIFCFNEEVSVAINNTNAVPIDITFEKVTNVHNKVASCFITKTKTKSYSEQNFYHMSNSHRHIKLSMQRGLIIIDDAVNFRPVKLSMDYIKIPRIINYRTDTLSEIKINDKIINLTVQHLKALIKDEGYQFMLNENKTI